MAALDKSVQAQVLNLLQELKTERHLTYLFISHDLHVVHYLADRVMVMYLGQVVEIGPVGQLYTAPRHPYTKALLSAVPSMDPAKRTERSPLAGDPPNPNENQTPGRPKWFSSPSGGLTRSGRSGGSLNPPSGCRFRDRCPLAHPRCAAEVPLLREASDGHFSACHLEHLP